MKQYFGTTLLAESLQSQRQSIVVFVDQTANEGLDEPRLRARLDLPRGASEEQALEAARQEDNVAVHLDGRTMRRIIHVPDRLLNLVVS